MMGRRSFLLGSVPAAVLGLGMPAPRAQEGAAKTPVFELIFVKLEFGPQMGRLLNWLETRMFPLFRKHGFGPTGVFTAEVAAHLPTAVVLRSHASLADMQAAWQSIARDSALAATEAELESPGPAFLAEDYRLLEATAFCPPLKPAAPEEKPHQVYELRIYKSATYRQHEFVHQRFAGGEIDIFHKSGIYPVLYADTVFGPDRPNMAYLIPFDDLAARKRGWAAFRDNPDWQKLRDDSVRRGGEIVQQITNMLLTPAKFSMLR